MMCVGFLFLFSCDIPQQRVVSDYCVIARPIYWHRDDTRGTKEQVDSHNRVWKHICKSEKK